MTALDKAIQDLKHGKFVLLHDANDRENETDFVVAAEFVESEHVEQMRRDGGGLICLAVGKELSKTLQLPFLADVLDSSKERFPFLKGTKADDIPYDEKSSFSVSINHRKTFTGISDEDRALTIREFGKFCKNLPEKPTEEFGKLFRAPGHVHLLVSSGIENRKGHTELATALLKLAGLTLAAAICEMLDSETHKSLSREKAMLYAKKKNITFLDAKELI